MKVRILPTDFFLNRIGGQRGLLCDEHQFICAAGKLALHDRDAPAPNLQ